MYSGTPIVWRHTGRKNKKQESREDLEPVILQSHRLGNVRVFNDVEELLERDLPVSVLISFHDGFVNNLLELEVLQIVPNHHFENEKELSVRDVSVPVNVVDFECDCAVFPSTLAFMPCLERQSVLIRTLELLLLLALRRECREARDKLFEINVSGAVIVKDGQESLGKGIRRDLGEGEELFLFQRP